MGTMEKKPGFLRNTVSGVATELGSIVGVKGGGAWMREQFSLNKGWSSQWGKAWNRGGLVGLGQHAKHFFGFGFDMSAKGGLKTHEMLPYLKTLPGARRAATMAGFGGRGVGLREEMAGLAGLGALGNRAGGAFTRRRIAGGVALGAGLVGVSQTVGLGNAAIVGGSALGAAAVTRYIGKSRGWTGARGGKLGAGLAGLGLLTGVI